MMNQDCYRVLFNPRLGQLRVVSELARCRGSRAGGTINGRHSLKRLRVIIISGLLGSGGAAWANIVADSSAPAHQQPRVSQALNGVTVVDIQTPNAQGLSHNVYRQCDLEKNGTVFNNSAQTVQTQLAGQIAGNAHLTRGSAQVILNEVNSSNPSYLRGFAEIAGQKAQLIISNPSGIQIAGARFINTQSLLLTTGKPQLQKGNLESYRVTSGQVQINGEGLDTRQVDYTAIIAQAVQLNAKVHAKRLTMVTGNNQIRATDHQVTPINGKGDKPEFALDIAQLGGMYAGHIFIVGTQDGVGMRNAGTLVANSGSVNLDNRGNLQHSGVLQSRHTIKLQVSGEKSTITQTANAVTTAGQTVGDSSATTGKINYQASGGIMLSGCLVSSGTQRYQAANLQVATAELQAKKIAIKATTQAVNLTNAKVQATQQVTVQAPQVVLEGHTQLATGQLTLIADTIENTGGRLTTDRQLFLQSNQIMGTGTFSTKGNLQIDLTGAQPKNSPGDYGRLAISPSRLATQPGTTKDGYRQDSKSSCKPN